MQNSEQEAARSRREIEAQVWAEGQEWMRQRRQQELQKEADRHGRVFPPKRDGDGGTPTYRDSRVRAAIPMSSPSPLGASYAAITIPCLHLTGTKDDSPLFGTTAKDRRYPFDHTKGPGQWLITFADATHMTFSGRGAAKHLDYIRQITLIFWDAHLKHDAAAKKWLTDGTLERTLCADATVERK